VAKTYQERCEQEVRRLIRTLKAAGWEPTHVYNGGEHVKVKGERETLENVFAVDESTITFAKGEARRGVFIVLGNEPEDLVCDYTASDDSFGQAMDSY
jgi:hypothetical protein